MPNVLPFRLVLRLSLALLTGCVGPEIPRASSALQDGIHWQDELAVVRTGTPGARRLLFLHGTPGSWEAFSAYLEDPQLSARFDMYAIDRPGFGATRLPLMPDLERQARALRPWCEAHGPFIIVGHSLGSSLALALAVAAPGCVDAILSIAGSVAARYERPRWFNRMAEWPVVRGLIPGALQRANREVLALGGSLDALEPAFAQLRVPIVLMQGAKDGLVDPRSARDLIDRLPADAPVRLHWLPEHGHFVLWEDPSLIRQALITLAEELATPRTAAEEHPPASP